MGLIIAKTTAVSIFHRFKMAAVSITIPVFKNVLVLLSWELSLVNNYSNLLSPKLIKLFLSNKQSWMDELP